MDEELSWEEIQRRFPDECVVIVDPEVSSEFEIAGGRVVHHSADRDAAYDMVDKLRPARFTVPFTGELIPDGVTAIL